LAREVLAVRTVQADRVDGDDRNALDWRHDETLGLFFSVQKA
jgi:hypothetical protein